jgi:U5 small nuclear ribonucleoprotein component
MDQELYDEFGNYIGGNSEDQEELEGLEKQFQNPDDEMLLLLPFGGEDLQMHEQEEQQQELNVESTQAYHQIVLHEDKKYYPSAQEVFGEHVEALVHEEDAQPITQPIIAPVKEPLKFEHDKSPVTFYNKE